MLRNNGMYTLCPGTIEGGEHIHGREFEEANSGWHANATLTMPCEGMQCFKVLLWSWRRWEREVACNRWQEKGSRR